MKDKRVIPIAVLIVLAEVGIPYGAGLVFGKTAGVIVGVVGLLALLLLIAASQRAQQVVPGLGRLPLVHDHGLQALPKELAEPRPPTRPDLASTLQRIVRDGEAIQRERRIVGPIKFVEAVFEWIGSTERRLKHVGADALLEDFRTHKDAKFEMPVDAHAAGAYLGGALKLIRDAQEDVGAGFLF